MCDLVSPCAYTAIKRKAADLDWLNVPRPLATALQAIPSRALRSALKRFCSADRQWCARLADEYSLQSRELAKQWAPRPPSPVPQPKETDWADVLAWSLDEANVDDPTLLRILRWTALAAVRSPLFLSAADKSTAARTLLRELLVRDRNVALLAHLVRYRHGRWCGKVEDDMRKLHCQAVDVGHWFTVRLASKDVRDAKTGACLQPKSRVVAEGQLQGRRADGTWVARLVAFDVTGVAWHPSHSASGCDPTTGVFTIGPSLDFRGYRQIAKELDFGRMTALKARARVGGRVLAESGFLLSDLARICAEFLYPRECLQPRPVGMFISGCPRARDFRLGHLSTRLQLPRGSLSWADVVAADTPDAVSREAHECLQLRPGDLTTTVPSPVASEELDDDSDDDDDEKELSE